MFSYRHAFHAGNHADVLKHTVLIAMIRHLTEKEAPLTVIDTHAGAGLYRLDGDFTATSGEAGDGIFRLISEKNQPPAGAKPADAATQTVAPALQDYLDLVQSFNASAKAGAAPKVYPGSPFIVQQFLREQDKLKLFELHPTDSRTLSANIAQLDAGRQIAVLTADGFEGIKKFLPPPARRALVLCDPSYELKNDYPRVLEMVADALKRFATGTYAVWYPIIPRPEAHDLPRRLKTLATKAGKPWLHATLAVKSGKAPLETNKVNTGEKTQRPGLTASGMFIINPPFGLKPALAAALPQMVTYLGQDKAARQTLESAG
ncbi:MAG: 23S rRNA (adenine(2030)-N(6))-methyltransferase RlmJ [Pseudomonadota bacterium]